MKFVLRLVIGVIILICLTSIISLSLILANANQAKTSMLVSKYALQRANNIRDIRIVFRHILALGNDFLPNSDLVASDRLDFYMKIL